MHIIALGHNHTTALLEAREQLAFDSDRLLAALRTLSEIDNVQESVILSTCNRNEIYCVVSDREAATDTIADFMLGFHDANTENLRSTLYTFTDDEAVKHLFSVAAGVDSLIVGETQILAQLKDAYAAARQANTTGPVLNKLFNRCFETGKKVRHQTRISQGAVSVSFAAAELAKKIFSSLEHKTVLLIGAGETSELTAMNLANNGIASFIVANRTYEKAVQLANHLNGTAIELDRIVQHAGEADIIISSTASRSYVLSTQDLAALMQKRKNAPLFVIDLAVPRDIEPGASELYNVFLYNIDDLSAIAEQNKKERQKEIVKAYDIIDKSVSVFGEWYRSLDVTPTLVSLREHFEAIRRSEMEQLTRNLTPDQKELVDRTTRSLMNKLLHNPSVEIKKAAGNGSGHVLTQSIRKLFNLQGNDE